MRKFRSITSASDANLYVGPFGEIVVDNSGQLRIQDNVTAGGHLITTDTGAITFSDSTIGTSNISSVITVDSNIFAISNVVVVGNIVSSTTELSLTAGTHSFVFTDVSVPGFNVGTGSILKFDNIESSSGPTFETWYGETDNPYDPPGQHSMDIRIASNAAVDYVEFASFDWNNFMGLSNDHAFIYTDWNGNPEQSWIFNKFGEMVLPNQGIIKSHNGNSTVIIADSNITISTDNAINNWAFGTDGVLKLPAGGDITDSTGTSVLGSAALGNYKIASGIIGTKDNPDTGGWGGYNIYLDPGGESSAGILIPSVSNQNTGSSLDIYNNANVNSAIHLGVNGGTYFFRKSELEVIHNASINQNNAYTRVTTPSVGGLQNSAVIWTALYDYVSSVKLTIQLETNQIGDATGWHSQVCEAIIASRGWANNTTGYGDPIMTVYGVTYTSTVPLATFTVQRNATTKLIEIVATRTAATDSGIDFRIHSVEMSSRD